MTRAVVVTTTINVPTLLRDWALGMSDDDAFVVVGDQKSPHDAIDKFMESLGTRFTYLRPDAQSGWAVSEHIGWNTIARRNVGTLEAIKCQPKFITMIDDDNVPEEATDVYLSRVEAYFTDPLSVRPATSPSGYVDTCFNFYEKSWRHRGFPPHLRYSDTTEYHEKKTLARIGVFESHWVGHPDIDAVDRIAFPDTYDPMCDDVMVPAYGHWAPFNSQATSYHSDLAPLMFVWPHIGRADDIFGSYLARAIMDQLDWYAAHGAPFVRHERDAYGERNLNFAAHVKDLKNEMFCYEYTDAICKILRDNAPSEIGTTGRTRYDIISLMNYYFGVIKAYATFIPHRTLAAMDAWLEDVTRATYRNES